MKHAKSHRVHPWIGGLAEWVEGDTAFLSVAFTWKVKEAFSRAVFLKAQGFKVKAGGPGLFINSMRKELESVAEVGGTYPDAIRFHNPQATMASRGCSVGCWFCIVPKMEGKDFTLIPDFPVRPILCDNNLSALPAKYQDHILARYKETGVTLMDCQEGFEPLTFTDEVYHRWKPNYKGPWRFAYDELKERPQVLRVMEMLKAENQKKKRVYVLIGNEPYVACMSRIYETIEKGCDPHAQAFIPLNSLDKEPQAKFDWTVQKLKDVCRWTNAWMWKKVKFEDYDRHMKTSKVGEIAARRMSQEVLL